MSPPATLTPAPSHPLQQVYEWLLTCDRAISRLLAYRLPHPPRLTRLVGIVSRAGDHGYIWYALASAPILGGRRQGGRYFAYVAGGQAAAEIVTYLIKTRCRRCRPPYDEGDPAGYIRRPQSHSFPSAHASMGVLGVTTLSRLYPRLRTPLAVLLAFLVFSRVYLRVHYAADVAAGLLLGGVLADVYARMVRAPVDRDDGA